MSPRTTRSACALACAALLAAGASAATAQTPTQAAMIEEIFALANLDEPDLQDLRDGSIVLGDDDILEEFELSDTNLTAVLFALVRAPLDRVATTLERTLATATLEEAAFVGTLRPGRPFPAVGFSEADAREVRRLLAFDGGGRFNLAAAEIAAIRSLAESGGRDVDAARAEVSRLVRGFLDERFRRYLARGLDGLSDYRRGGDAVTSPADELRLVESDLRVLEKYCSPVYQELIAYPEISGDLVHTYRVVKKPLNKRPAFVLMHRIVDAREDQVTVAQREFYVSHTYNSLTSLVLMLPWEGGTLVLMTTDTFTDKLAGMPSAIAKPIGRKRIRSAMLPLMEKLKRSAEAGGGG